MRRNRKGIRHPEQNRFQYPVPVEPICYQLVTLAAASSPLPAHVDSSKLFLLRRQMKNLRRNAGKRTLQLSGGGGRDILPGRLITVKRRRCRIVGDASHQHGIRGYIGITAQANGENNRRQRRIAANPVRGVVKRILTGVSNIVSIDTIRLTP